MTSLIKINIKEKKIGKHKVLSDISFSFFKGKIVSIVGQNGSGKTTLLNCLLSANLEKNIEFELNGIDLTNLNIDKFANYVSHLGSSDFSMPNISVKTFIKNSKYNKELDEKKYLEIINIWDLKNIEEKKVNTLSMGQFQRVLLASVLLQEAELYILDEPERHLDPNGIKTLEKCLMNKSNNGKSILISTHNINFALSVSNIIVGLKNDGTQSYYGDLDIAYNNKIFDEIFNAKFNYVKLDNNSMKVFV